MLNETLPQLLLRQSEAGPPSTLPGYLAKDHFGPAFESLVSHGLIVELESATTWPTCDSCDCGLDWRPIQRVRGALVAPCPTNSAFDMHLDEDAIRMFEIGIEAVVAKIALDSSFGDDLDEVADGVWFVGSTLSGRAVFVAPSVRAVQQPGVISVLRSNARGSPVTLLTAVLSPAHRKPFKAADIHCVAIRHILNVDEGTSFTVQAEQLDPVSTTEPTLIVNRHARSAILEGRTIKLSDRPFKLLVLLAEAAKSGGLIVSNKEIERRLWGKVVVSMGAVADAVRDLRKQLGGDSEAMKALIQGRPPQRYVLNLAAHEIRIVP